MALCNLLFFLVFSLIPITIVPESLDVPLIPRKILFQKPKKVLPKISPDGRRVAYLKRIENTYNIALSALDGSQERTVTSYDSQSVANFTWSSDSKKIVYTYDRDEDDTWHVYAYDLETESIRNLTPYDGIHAKLVQTSHKDPNQVYLILDLELPFYHDLYTISVDTGELTLIEKNSKENPVRTWLFNNQEQVLGKVTVSADRQLYEVWVLDQKSKTWKSVYSWRLEEADSVDIIGFTPDSQALYLITNNDSDKRYLGALDINTGKLLKIYEHPQYDIDNVICNPFDGEVEAIEVIADRRQIIPLKPNFDQIMQELKSIDREIDIFSSSFDDQLWIVGSHSDTRPRSYYIYDRKLQEANLLFKSNPELEAYSLSPMETFKCLSRDGLTLEGYVTYPLGVKREKLPMVLLVRDSFRGRDTWGYNPEVQWFANRGYMCVQVNFRGSSGFGKRFQDAGDREWGRAMELDLIDTVRYFIAQGDADPSRVSIYGGDYGGYAALCAACDYPELFCCACDINGPVNLETLARYLAYYHPKSRVSKILGDPERDQALFFERSPVHKAQAISIPIYIAHNLKDPRIQHEDIDHIVSVLKESKKPYYYHAFSESLLDDEENDQKMYGQIEQFLTPYLKGRNEPWD
ncbi:MAG TPA: prolyl oligopeptidase family serine peptidase, partial [Candidatus Babeliaceae bacterium]|nr:prolyl oligopeptidase family serine peptidase [Candidatus Babeliaceae bacterium]